jgi:hypothetical protein
MRTEVSYRTTPSQALELYVQRIRHPPIRLTQDQRVLSHSEDHSVPPGLADRAVSRERRGSLRDKAGEIRERQRRTRSGLSILRTR